MSKKYNVPDGASIRQVSNRVMRFPEFGGPRKYPTKYVWSIVHNHLTIQEVRYFKNKRDRGYYFFFYIDGVTTRRAKVADDREIFDSYQLAVKNQPEFVSNLQVGLWIN